MQLAEHYTESILSNSEWHLRNVHIIATGNTFYYFLYIFFNFFADNLRKNETSGSINLN